MMPDLKGAGVCRFFCNSDLRLIWTPEKCYEKMKVPDKRSIRMKAINTKLIVTIRT